MARRYFSSTAVATTLSGNVNNSTTSIDVTALSGFPNTTPWTAILDKDTASEEVVTVTNVSGTTLTVTRGVDGTSAVSHNAGASFSHGVSARDFDEANSHVNDTSTDVHSQYVSKSLINAKGDLVTATANDTPAIQSVGANGEVLYADSSATNGLRWQPVYNAGRNRVINGGFDVWQRGTSISVSAGAVTYTADRWYAFHDGNGTATVSRQAFTAGTAPVADYEGQYFGRWAVGTVGTTTAAQFGQRIESSRVFAGQTVTFSAWMKADSTRSIDVYAQQAFGSGGSTSVTTTVATFSVGTTWTRYTATVAIPSVSGKTIGAGDYLQAFFQFIPASGFTLDIWGVQLEAGSVATRFEEEPYEETLRKCQRYYWRQSSDATANYLRFNTGIFVSTTEALYVFQNPTTMRTAPSVSASGTFAHFEGSTSRGTTAPGILSDGTNATSTAVQSGSLSGATAGNAALLRAENSSATYIEFSAEL